MKNDFFMYFHIAIANFLNLNGYSITINYLNEPKIVFVKGVVDEHYSFQGKMSQQTV